MASSNPSNEPGMAGIWQQRYQKQHQHQQQQQQQQEAEDRPELMTMRTLPIGASPSEAQGKTGRHIDRLTADNTRLRHELNAERAKHQEVQDELRTSRAVANSLRDELDNLRYINETEERAEDRKDRKIADLRAALDAEVARRKSAENREAALKKLLDDAEADANKRVAAEKEVTKHTHMQYAALRRTYLELKTPFDEMQRNLDTYWANLQRHHHNLQKEVCKREKLEVIVEGQQREHARYEQVIEDLRKVELSRGAELQEKVSAIKVLEQKNEKLADQMAEAVAQMRWVMRLANLKEE